MRKEKGDFVVQAGTNGWTEAKIQDYWRKRGISGRKRSKRYVSPQPLVSDGTNRGGIDSRKMSWSFLAIPRENKIKNVRKKTKEKRKKKF